MTKQDDIIRFGNDGWVARFDDGFTADNVARLAEALAVSWADEQPGAHVYVGFDTRHSAREHAHIVAAALAAYGLQVQCSNRPVPTPVLSWTAARNAEACGVVMLTASEMPAEYGGLIVRGADGGAVLRSFLERVEQAIVRVPTFFDVGFEECDFFKPYAQHIKQFIDVNALQSAQLPVVLDSMHGTVGSQHAELLRELGCTVSEVHSGPLSSMPSVYPDPKAPWIDTCEQVVSESGAVVGFAFDADGDRGAVINHEAKFVFARSWIPLLLKHLVDYHHFSGKVVSSLTSSLRIAQQAHESACTHLSVPVGFDRMYQEIQEGDVIFASEEYAGICIPAHLPERDAFFAFVLLLELLAIKGTHLQDLIIENRANIPPTYYARHDVRLESAKIQSFRNILPGLNPELVYDEVPVHVSHADGLRVQFKDQSWFMLRPSRRQGLVRLYAEALTAEKRDQLLEYAHKLITDFDI